MLNWYFRENFGVLNVYFDELTYHDVHEERTYDVSIYKCRQI